MSAFWILILVANMFACAGIVSRQLWPYIGSFLFVGIAVAVLVTGGAS